MNSDYEKMLHDTIGMTDEDALEILNSLLPAESIPRKSSKDITSLSLQIALSRAITALKEKVETSEDFKKQPAIWIYKKFDEKTGISDSYFCSRCDFPLTGIYNNYCSVCGADMRNKALKKYNELKEGE